MATSWILFFSYQDYARSNTHQSYLFLNINQLDALNFIISLFQASTCFEHMCSSSGGQKLYYTVCGIITPIDYARSNTHQSYSFLNIKQLDTLNFIISLFQASTCFEHTCSSSDGQKLYYTVSGIITPIGGRPFHGTATYRFNDTIDCIIQFLPS